MPVSSTVEATFKCSIERAFKTPILGDATQILTGYWIIPAVSGFKDDESWGHVGGHRIPLSHGNWLVRAGSQGYDEILVREENKYWKWQISEFTSFSMFFTIRATGELFFKEVAANQVQVKWVYTFKSRNLLYHPLTWCFTRILWLPLMQQGILKMKRMTEANAGLIYN